MPNSDKRNQYLPIAKITLLVSIAFFFLISGPLIDNALSQSLSINSQAPKKNEAIEINADRMRSIDSGKKIIFSGNVVGVWGDLEIRSDIFELYTDKGRKKSKGSLVGGQTLREIIAIGNVSIKRGNKRAKGDRAIYHVDQKKIILTGSPRATAWENDSKIEGREMIFLLEEDRIVVNGRVEVKFFPKNKPPVRSKKYSRSR